MGVFRVDSLSGTAPAISSRRTCWLSLVAALPVTLALVAGDAQADIYRYVDKDGVVHFSNRTKQGKRVSKKNEPKPSVASRARSFKADGIAPTRYDGIIREAATLYQIPEALIRAVIRVESGFNPRALSHANAHGLMQLIPATAERMMVTDIYDPRQNIFGGTRYLRVLANLFNGNLQLTLAGYNAGESAVIKYGGIPPYEETRHYVTKVLHHYEAYRRAMDGAR